MIIKNTVVIDKVITKNFENLRCAFSRLLLGVNLL